MLRHALLLFAVCSVALAAVYLVPLEEKPEQYKDCEGCWVSEINTFIPLGETVPSPIECKGYHCQSDYLQVQTCGVVGGSCKIVENLCLPYPDCCQIVCSDTE